MGSLDDFIKNESSRMNWYERTFSKYPELFSTHDLAYDAPGLSIPAEKIIRPSWSHKMINFVLLCWALMFWLLLMNMVIKQVLLPITIGGLFFVTLVMSILLWNGFLNKRYIYTIRLSKDKVQVDQHIFLWSDISDTQILLRHMGRGRNSYLVIATKDSQVYKYSLFAFSMSDNKISTFIEVYKKRNERAT